MDLSKICTSDLPPCKTTKWLGKTSGHPVWSHEDVYWPRADKYLLFYIHTYIQTYRHTYWHWYWYWYSGFQVTGMIKWGQIKKSLDQNLTPPLPCKKNEKNPIPGYAETIRNLQIVLNTQKNSLLKSRYQKILAKIFLSKFQTQTILRSFPSYEIWSTPQGRYIHHLSGIRRYMLGRVRFKRKRRD